MYLSGRIVRVKEPPDADLVQVLESIRSGTYRKPFVIDESHARSLHFDLDSVQTEMNLKNPNELMSRYTQKMMAFLLFVPVPKHILIIGLGGGALTKFCYRQLKVPRITTVEIDRNVIGFADMFDIPAPDARLRIVHGNAVEYVAKSTDSVDVALVDGCDKWGIAQSLCETQFLEQLRKRLTPRAVVAINLVGVEIRVERLLRSVQNVFGQRFFVVQVAGCDNQVLFAFNGIERSIDWNAIQDRAKVLSHRYRLDFLSYARRLRESREREHEKGV